MVVSWLAAPFLKRLAEPAEFFPSLQVLEEPKPPQSPADMIAVLKSLNPPPAP